jgi:AbrB family looped-hinge helix DNA binding protein
MPTAVKITRKGQVTIPKEIREKLGSNIVEFELSGDKVIVKPVKSIAASLRTYSKEYAPLKQVREKVWEKVVHDRIRKKTS